MPSKTLLSVTHCDRPLNTLEITRKFIYDDGFPTENNTFFNYKIQVRRHWTIQAIMGKLPSVVDKVYSNM